MKWREKRHPYGVNYGDNRDHIRNGDILLYEGSSIYSWFIKWVTKSRYSHAGVAVWWNQRLMVMEAVGRGVVVTPLSVNIAHYHGDVHWFSSRQPIAPAARRRMVIFAQEELGKEYALRKALWLGVQLLFRWKREIRDELRREQKLFCSAYVAQIYNSVGIDLKKGVSDAFMTPQDIAQSPELVEKGVLKLEMVTQAVRD